MDDLIYISLLGVLAVLAAFSFYIDTHKTASMVVMIWLSILFSMLGLVFSLSAGGSLAGLFFMLILGITVSFVFVIFYGLEKTKLLLKLATTSAAFALTNIMCIMTFIKPIRELNWYHAPTFDLFYWNYGELQIVLTLYMISLFWKSGIMGLSNGFNATRRYINSIHSVRGGLPGSNSVHIIGSSMASKDKVYKKRIME